MTITRLDKGASNDDGIDDGTDNRLACYIAAIGNRIRALRTSRGMIRKDLSRQSGVSERYIAQIETGQANISVAMLWKIAQCMDLRIPDLFPDSEARAGSASLMAFFDRLESEQQQAALELMKRRFGKPAQKIRGVALIGLRGAGKSSIGGVLARRFGVRFVQISVLIEQQAQMSTAELFSLGGQKAYRRMEKKALDDARGFEETVVLETAGSLVTRPAVFRSLLDSYYTVWIRASAQDHMNRVLAQGDLRPMAGSDEAMEDIKLILREREAGYNQADYILDTSGRDIQQCARELAERCADHLGQASASRPRR